jgi:DNA-binding NarL/FixJ family response regulator
MSDTHSPNEPEPKTQLESARGGSGRKGRTAIGAGNGGNSDNTDPSVFWPEGPNLVNRPRTIICDRHELLRAGLKAMIEPFVQIVGEVADGMAAIEYIRRLRPDLVVLDVDLDLLNGVEVCRRVGQELLNSTVLVFTDSYHATKNYNRLTRVGALGLCLKSSGPQILFEAIEQVTRSLPYCDPKITQFVKQSPTISTTPKRDLTDGEIEVLIRLDMRNNEICEELDIQLRAVEKHIYSILQKLQVPTRTAAALKAVQMGYRLLPVMISRDTLTGKTHEQIAAEKFAEEALRRQTSTD